MKLITEYDERKKAVLEQYNIRVESLGKGFAAIETDNCYFKMDTSYCKKYWSSCCHL